jgi:hypothetical protein
MLKSWNRLPSAALWVIALGTTAGCHGQNNATTENHRPMANAIYGLIEKPKSDAKDIEKFKKTPGFHELTYEISEGRQTAYYFPPAGDKGEELVIYLHGRNDLNGTAFDPVLSDPGSIGLPDNVGRLFMEYIGNGPDQALHEGPSIQTNHEDFEAAIAAYEKTTGNTVKKIKIIAHSLGTLVAVEETVRDARVDADILAAPLNSVKTVLEANKIKLALKYHISVSSFDPAKDGYDALAALSELSHSDRPLTVMLFRGSKDEDSTAEIIASLQKAYPAAKVQTFDGVNHDHIVDSRKQGAGRLAEAIKTSGVFSITAEAQPVP